MVLYWDSDWPYSHPESEIGCAHCLCNDMMLASRVPVCWHFDVAGMRAWLHGALRRVVADWMMGFPFLPDLLDTWDFDNCGRYLPPLASVSDAERISYCCFVRRRLRLLRWVPPRLRYSAAGARLRAWFYCHLTRVDLDWEIAGTWVRQGSRCSDSDSS